MKRFKYAVICLLIVGAFTNVNAQDEKEVAADSVSLDDLLDMDFESLMNVEVNVGSMKASSLQDNPYNISVVDSKDIDKMNYYNIPSALQFQQGYTITHINTGQDQVGSQGSNPFQKGTIRFLINGQSQYFDQYNITPWSTLPVIMDVVKRVEGVKGIVPYYGRNALNGAINIEMQKEVEKTQTIASAFSGTYGRQSLSLTHKQKFDNGVQFVGAISKSSVNNSYNFNSQYSEDKAAGTLVDQDEYSSKYLTSDKNDKIFEMTNYYTSLFKKLDNGSMQLYFGGNIVPLSKLRLPDRICATYTASKSNYFGYKYLFDSKDKHTSYDLSVFTSSFQSKFLRNGSHQNDHFDNVSTDFNTFSASGYKQPKYDRITGNLQLSGQHSYGKDDKNSILFKPMLKWTSVIQENFFGESSTDLTILDTLSSTNKNYDFIESAFLLQFKHSFIKNLTHTLDLRLDNNFHGNDKYINTKGILFANVFKISDKHSFRLSASYMERPPELEEMFSQIKLYLGTSSKIGEYLDNPNLGIESNASVDIGFLGQITNKLSYNISGFISQRKDIIELEYLGEVSVEAVNGTDTITKAMPRYRFNNANNLDLIGAQFELKYNSKNFFAQVGVTYQDITSVEGHLTGVPSGRYGSTYLSPLQASAIVGYTYKKISATLSGKYVEQHVWLWPAWKKGKGESFNEKEVKAYYPIDINISYGLINNDSKVFVQVKNLAGEIYNTWRADKANNYIGREVLVGVKFAF